MNIICNGKRRTLNDSSTLNDLLSELGLKPDTVVAEVNKKIIDRDQHETMMLSEGDQVELIRFVGGG